MTFPGFGIGSESGRTLSLPAGPWLYLGLDSLDLERLKRAFPGYRSLQPELEREGWKNRRRFLKDKQQGPRLPGNDLAQLVSLQNDQDTVAPGLFLGICKIRAVRLLLRKVKTIGVISPCAALTLDLLENLPPGFRKHADPAILKIRFTFEILTAALGAFLKMTLGLLYFGYLLLGFRIFGKKRPFCQEGEKWILLQSCLNPRDVQGTRIHERYLSKFARNTFADPSRVKRVWVYWFHPPNWRPWKFWRRKLCPRNYLVLESLLGWRDFFWAWGVFLRSRRATHPVVLCGVRVPHLLRLNRIQGWGNSLLIFHILMYAAIRRLRQNGCSLARVVTIFENYSAEKPLIAAVREFYPDAIIHGYCHSGVQAMNLRYYFASRRPNARFLPDQIHTQGAFFSQRLARNGFPAPRLVVSGGYRRTRLRPAPKQGGRGAGPRIGVLLPLEANSAVELAAQIKDLANHAPARASWWLRFHPMFPEMCRQEIQARLPPGVFWRICDEPAPTRILRWITHLITNDGSMALEGIINQKKVLIIKKDLSFQQTIFDWPEMKNHVTFYHPQAADREKKLTSFFRPHPTPLSPQIIQSLVGSS